MDSLTQIVLGGAVGEVVLGKKVGNWAVFWGAVAGTIPDLDVFSNYFVDTVQANEWHRGFSHSIIFCVLMAPLLGWLVAKIHKRKEVSWKAWTILFFMALITHPLLDAHTAWGTQLFWPLDYKVAYKNIFVIDPLYTLPFLLFLIIAMCFHREDKKRRFYNKLGLIVSSLYMLLTISFKGITYHQFTDSLKAQGIEYQTIQTRPTPLNSVLWSANVETDNAYLIGYYSLFDQTNDIEFIRFDKNHSSLGAMADEELVKRLIRLSEGWFTIEQEDGKTIFNDLRFGLMGVTSASKKFVFSYELFYENETLIARETEKSFKGMDSAFKELLNRISGK